MSRFVVVVDTQGDFMRANGALPVAGAEALIEPMRAWLARLSPADTAGVLFTFDTHVPEVYAASAEAELFPLHCVWGTAGWENVLDPASVDPRIPVYRLDKGEFDMWSEPALEITESASGMRTDRDAFFMGLKASGIDEITVVGVAADYCVRWAVAGLLARGFKVTVPAALTRGIDRQVDEVAREEFAGGRFAVDRA
jgi:nicotinamidase/pyrazinamidase